jgi:hypothetical protein
MMVVSARFGGGRGWRLAGFIIASLTIVGCSNNPILGKWNIDKREKEMRTSYMDELTTNVQSSSGATQIEFRKDSILITGGPNQHLETGVTYSVQELESGAVDVRILQQRPGATSADIDFFHIAAGGNTAQLESRTELIDLSRAPQ